MAGAGAAAAAAAGGRGRGALPAGGACGGVGRGAGAGMEAAEGALPAGAGPAGYQALRREVFIEEQAVSEAEEWDGRDEDAWHVVLYDAAAPPACVACARLLVDEGGQAAAVGRVAVARSQRERGVGSLLMARVHELALGRLGLLSLRLDAQVQVIPFYEKMGYSLVPGEVFLDAGIPHRKMLLKN